MHIAFGVAGFNPEVAKIMCDAEERGWQFVREASHGSAVILKLPIANFKPISLRKRAQGKGIMNIEATIKRAERMSGYKPPAKIEKPKENKMGKPAITAHGLESLGDALVQSKMKEIEQPKPKVEPVLSADDMRDLTLFILRAYGFGYSKIGDIVGRPNPWVTDRVRNMINKRHLKPDEFTMEDFDAVCYFKSSVGRGSYDETGKPTISPALSPKAAAYVKNAVSEIMESYKQRIKKLAANNEEVEPDVKPDVKPVPATAIVRTTASHTPVENGVNRVAEIASGSNPQPVKESKNETSELNIIARLKNRLKKEIATALNIPRECVKININIEA